MYGVESTESKEFSAFLEAGKAINGIADGAYDAVKAAFAQKRREERAGAAHERAVMRKMTRAEQVRYKRKAK